MIARGVIDAPQTFACRAIAVADSVGIDVVVAVTLSAWPRFSPQPTDRITKISVLAQLAPPAGSSLRAFHANGTFRVLEDFDAGTAVRTRTGLAVVRGSDDGVAVVALGAHFAVMTRREVAARTLT